MTSEKACRRHKYSKGGQRRLRKGTGAVCLLFCLSLLLSTAVCSVSDCGRQGAGQKEYTLNSFFFDTVIAIRFTAGEDGQALADGCSALCDQIEHTFSRTDPSSELYAVNHRTEDTVEVSPELAELVQTGLDYYARSQGMLDITVAPLSDLWDFKSGDAKVPEVERIAAAAARVDARGVRVLRLEADKAETEPDVETTAGLRDTEREPGAHGAGAASGERYFISFSDPDTMLDLGALVKGYAADRLAAYLESAGVTSGLINLGGNVKAIGAKPGGDAWKVGIRKPFSEDLLDTVSVRDTSVVTSGVYERCFEQDGVLYHHILDPRTGYPVQNGLWSVTILCSSSLEADALSTTCLALGQEKAEALIRSLDGVSAIFADSEGHVSRVEAEGRS